MKYNTATPYIASYVIVRKQGKIAMLFRSNTDWMNGYYGLASGKVEKNESFLSAAIREAQEEVGIEVRPENLRQIHTMHRKNPEGIEWVDVYFETEKWQGNLRNAESDLHEELAWFAIDNLPKNTIPSLRYALEQIEAGKQYSEYGWS